MKQILFTFFLIITAASSAIAQPWTEDSPNVYVKIYPEKTDVKAGETITIGIEQIIRPQWHTYWQNPGDSGEPMRVRWNYNGASPINIQTDELQWPTPKDLPFGPLLNYGHEGKAVILQDITLPETLPNGPITLPVAFDILVCHDICIPETVESSISLNTDSYIDNTQIIHEAKTHLPLTKNDFAPTISKSGENIVIMLSGEFSPDTRAQFYPYAYGLLSPPAEPNVNINEQGLTFTQKAGDFAYNKVKDKSGVFVLEQDGIRTGYEISPKEVILSDLTYPIAPDLSSGSELNFLPALLFALLGGLILNLMPCVFPVLSMKVLSLCKMSSKEQKEARLHGIAYTAGIILSFIGIAAVLMALKSGGAQIGWGFQLQNPVVVLLLGYLFFLIGLSLAGLFEFGIGLMNVGQKFAGQSSLSGSFMTGILATIVATPCTAPFMAAALGYAVIQPAYISLSVFAALGLGLALPYLVISFIPSLQKILPKPGQWMVTFKEFLAFPMFLTTGWLLWVLAQQTGSDILFIVFLGLVGLGLAAWLLSKSHSTSLKLLAIIILALSIITATYNVQMVDMAKEMSMPEYGQPYSEEALDQALATDKPVFVEMTAAWCITCKLNHQIAINVPQTRKIIEDRNIIYLIGDWTNYDDHITAYLEKFGRNGVPIYVYYQEPDPATGQRAQPELLPQLLLPGTVAEVLNKKR